MHEVVAVERPEELVVAGERDLLAPAGARAVVVVALRGRVVLVGHARVDGRVPGLEVREVEEVEEARPAEARDDAARLVAGPAGRADAERPGRRVQHGGLVADGALRRL